MTYEYLNATDVPSLFVYANTVTGGMFWVLMSIVIWVVAFGVLIRRNDSKKSFAGSTFLTSIIIMMFFILGLVNSDVVITSIIMMFIGVLGLLM